MAILLSSTRSRHTRCRNRSVRAMTHTATPRAEVEKEERDDVAQPRIRDGTRADVAAREGTHAAVEDEAKQQQDGVVPRKVTRGSACGGEPLSVCAMKRAWLSPHACGGEPGLAPSLRPPTKSSPRVWG